MHPKSAGCGCISPQIEHRLFSAITTNWRGRPLTGHEVVVNLIGATTNSKGLKVHAYRDTDTYPPAATTTVSAIDVWPDRSRTGRVYARVLEFNGREGDRS